jgi:mannosyltransferase OCH1-like enzyme
MVWTYQEYIDSNTTKTPIFRTGNQTILELPTDIKELYEETLTQNPEYVIVYFTSKDCKDFITQYYPTYMETYSKLIPGAYKADLFRLLVIHRHGGIWCDFSMKFLVPINTLVDLTVYNFIVPIDANVTGLFNAFFAARPELHLLLLIADRIRQNVCDHYYGENALDPTGPLCWGRVLNRVLGRNEKSSFVGCQVDGIKFYKLSVHFMFTRGWNAFVHEPGTEKFLVQHKLTYFKNFGLASSHFTTYKHLWNVGKIYYDSANGLTPIAR